MYLRTVFQSFVWALVMPILWAASLTHVEEIGMPVAVPAMQLPKWTKGGLLTVQFKDPRYPMIWMLTRNGARSLPFSIPGADSTVVYDFDQSADGTIGLSGSATDADGRIAGFVAWVSPTQGNVQIVRTGLYRPAMVAIASDGSLWTVGRELNALTRFGKLLPNAGVIRHFEKSGKTLHSLVPQSTVRNHDLTMSRNTLRASADRVVWYDVGDGRLVEISFSGTVLRDVPLELPLAGRSISEVIGDSISFAVTDEGDCFLATPYVDKSSKQSSQQIYALDRSRRVWNPVSLGAQTARNQTGYIFGADGRRLVVMSGNLVQFYAIGK